MAIKPLLRSALPCSSYNYSPLPSPPLPSCPLLPHHSLLQLRHQCVVVPHGHNGAGEARQGVLDLAGEERGRHEVTGGEQVSTQASE